MAEPRATSSTRARIRILQEEWNSTKTIRGTFLGIQGEWNLAETLRETFLHILDLVLVIKY